MESASQDNLGESGWQMLNPESGARVTGEGAGEHRPGCPSDRRRSYAAGVIVRWDRAHGTYASVRAVASIDTVRTYI